MSIAAASVCRAIAAAFQDLLTQFFDNGGTNAICVRVAASERCHRIVMPGEAGDLQLSAINPGPHECLRASIDHDGIPAGDQNRFNLVIHRLMSRDRPIVEEQEIYRAISVDPADPDYVLHALTDSELVQPIGQVPLMRPEETYCPGVEVGGSYEYSDDDWREQESLTDYDLVGCNTEGTGLFALDRVPIVDVLCLVPDQGDVGPVAMFAAEQYCSARQALLFVDPPSTWQSVDDVIRDRMDSAFSSPNVATYFPRPVAQPGFGINRNPSALGALVGRLVSEDSHYGVWSARDTIELRCRVNLSMKLDEHERAALRRLGVNPLRDCFGGYAQATRLVTMERSKGLDAGGSDLHSRRADLQIVGNIARATRWVAFAGTDSHAWDDLRNQISAYMSELCAEGALPVGKIEADAWYVAWDDEHSDTITGAFVVGFALDGQQLHHVSLSSQSDGMRGPRGGVAAGSRTGGLIWVEPDGD